MTGKVVLAPNEIAFLQGVVVIVVGLVLAVGVQGRIVNEHVLAPARVRLLLVIAELVVVFALAVSSAAAVFLCMRHLRDGSPLTALAERSEIDYDLGFAALSALLALLGRRLLPELWQPTRSGVAKFQLVVFLGALWTVAVAGDVVLGFVGTAPRVQVFGIVFTLIVSLLSVAGVRRAEEHREPRRTRHRLAKSAWRPIVIVAAAKGPLPPDATLPLLYAPVSAADPKGLWATKTGINALAHVLADFVGTGPPKLRWDGPFGQRRAIYEFAYVAESAIDARVLERHPDLPLFCIEPGLGLVIRQRPPDHVAGAPND